MGNIIRVRRGANASLPTLNAGEFGFSTDTHQTYIGDGATNHELAKAGVNTDITSITAKIDQTNAIENTSKLLQTEDIFSDFVVTGLLPATSANLISDISLGHAYVTGTRVNKAVTSKTYTASKDTYVDINSAGTYTFVEVVLDAAAPAVTADSIRLAKVVTDTDNITGVTDLRELQGIFVGRNVKINGLLSQDGLGGSTYFGFEAGKVDDLSDNLNTGIGYQALLANTTGLANVALGYQTLVSNTTGERNAALGYRALYANVTGLRNIALGFYAGRFETGSDAFYVNNHDRTNTAGDKAKSIIYGIMAALVADQRLTFNADVKVTGRLKKSATAGITAYAGGGQASAVLLASDINEVSVCATAADSVKLPGGIVGMEIMVVNRGATAMNLFPAVGDYVNELAVDTAVSIAIDATAIAYCYVVDNWEVVEVTRA